MLDKLYITPKQWLHILRWCLYSLLFLAAILAQTVVFGNHTVLGVHPTFVPVVITCVCLREGPERGGLFALLASVFWCLTGADFGEVSIVVLTCVPLLGCVLARALISRPFLPCLVLSFLTLLIEQSGIFLFKSFSGGLEGSLYVTQLLPCVFVSLLAQPLTYYLVKHIERIGDPYESA